METWDCPMLCGMQSKRGTPTHNTALAIVLLLVLIMILFFPFCRNVLNMLELS